MDSEPGDPPVEHVTVDQVVARNIRHWRRAAGMTQEELGKKLGWSAANVSAAERSADPARDPRRFDAQSLAGLSLALGVPLIALFFPPEDDGQRARYAFAGPDREHGMDDLMGLVVMTDSDDGSAVMEEYRRRFRGAAGRYLDPGWAEEIAAWLRQAEDAELRADRAARLRAERDALMRAAESLGGLADAIDPAADPR
jgi:transcriptional regulator with XRE-family HTH domain